MKKFLLTVSYLLLTLTLSALGTLRVESIKELSTTHTNSEVRNADGKFAPVLIIKTELSGLGFQNIGSPTKHPAGFDAKSHKYKFYMNDNQRVVRITHAEYEPFELRLLADYKINVDPGKFYELELVRNKDVIICEVSFNTEPSESKIYLNDELLMDNKLKLEQGFYNIKVTKNSYKTVKRILNITEEKSHFDFTLAKKNKKITAKKVVKPKKNLNKLLLILVISPSILVLIIAVLKKNKIARVFSWFFVYAGLWVGFLLLLAIFFPEIKDLLLIAKSYLKFL